MKATNQGFIDLHTPFGFFLVGACFLLLTGIIILGSIFAKNLGAKEKEERAKLRAERDTFNQSKP